MEPITFVTTVTHIDRVPGWWSTAYWTGLCCGHDHGRGGHRSMRVMGFILLSLLVAGGVLMPGARRADAQDLGHKLPGLIGLDAGRIPQPGLYAIDRVVWYSADEVRDRSGNRIPVGDVGLLGIAKVAGLS